MQMSLTTLIPLVSKAVGRDLTTELNLFYRSRAALGSCMSDAGKVFFIQNWPKAVDFMETPEGQKAITAFLEAWEAHLKPQPEPEPVPTEEPEVPPQPT